LAFERRNLLFAVGLLLLGAWTATCVPAAWGQEDINRKLKIRVEPAYPELARHMSLSGVVRVQITIAANGSVKDTKLIGGHPILANAALDAVKKWRFEKGPEESKGIVEFRFDPHQ
jgi:TonB family protein